MHQSCLAELVKSLYASEIVIGNFVRSECADTEVAEKEKRATETSVIVIEVDEAVGVFCSVLDKPYNSNCLGGTT